MASNPLQGASADGDEEKAAAPQQQQQQQQRPSTRESDDSYTFLPREDRNATRGSILPHTAFYNPAKKRPSVSKPNASGSSPAPAPALAARDDEARSSSSAASPLASHYQRHNASVTDSSAESRPTTTGTATYLDVNTSGTAGSSSAATWTAPSSSAGSVSGHRMLGTGPDTRSKDPLLPSRGTTASRGTLITPPATAARRGGDGAMTMMNGHAEKKLPQPPRQRRQRHHRQPDASLLHPPGHSPLPTRNYSHHSGSNSFFLSGLIMTAHSNPLPFLLSLGLVLILGGLWLGFEASYQWHTGSPAIPLVFAYLLAGTVVNMLVTAWRDPGVLPRGLDPEPVMARPSSSSSSFHHDGDHNNGPSSRSNGFLSSLDPEARNNGGRGGEDDDALATPVPRIVRVRNGRDLTVKWCETCKLYRPPRSSHCRVCDNCVEAIDHHCTFLNTCIGRRNYTSFFAFLCLSLLTSAFAVVFSALHLYWLTLPPTQPRGGGKKGLGGALRSSPMSGVLFLVILMVMGPLSTLTMYHVRLVMMGRSTVEQMRINTTLSHTYPRPSTLYHLLSGLCCGLVPFWPSSIPPDSGGRPPLLRLGDARDDPNPFAYRSAWRNVVYTLCRPSVTGRWGAGGGVGGGLDRRGRRWVDGREVGGR